MRTKTLRALDKIDLPANKLYIGGALVSGFTKASLDGALAAVYGKIVDEVALAPSGNQVGNNGWTVFINGTGTGAFATKGGQIATYVHATTSWTFSGALAVGSIVRNKRTDVVYFVEATGVYADNTHLLAPVKESVTAPSGTEVGVDNYRVLVAGVGTGAFDTHDNKIAVWDDVEDVWSFYAIPDGAMVYDLATGLWMQRKTSSWVISDLHIKPISVTHAGGGQATKDIFLFTANRACTVKRASLVVATTLALDADNNWDFTLHNLTQDESLTVAPLTNEGAAITVNTRYAIAVDQNTSIAQNDVIVLRCTDAEGDPAALPELNCSVEIQEVA